MSEYRFETLQLHVGQETADPATDARAVPIYQTTSYVFHNSRHAADRFGLADAGNIYGRLTNSTQDVLEKRLAALEGGSAGLALASGAAAITYTIEALAANGGHIVAQKTIYGGTFNLLEHTLPQYGIKTTFVDIHNLAEVEAAITDDTRAIFLETLGNPNSDIPDIDAVAQIAHRHGLPVVIDKVLEEIRSRKGIIKADLKRISKKNKSIEDFEKLFNDDQEKVGETFSGVEIVQFCSNEDCSKYWEQYGMKQKFGVVVFWHFIVPKVLSLMEIVGCQYVFLFAADDSEDEDLVNYYKTWLKFESSQERSAATPVYDLTCKFLYQDTCSLKEKRSYFYDHFNPEEDAV